MKVSKTPMLATGLVAVLALPAAAAPVTWWYETATPD